MRKGVRLIAAVAVGIGGSAMAASPATVRADDPPVTHLCAVGTVLGCNTGVHGNGNLINHGGSLENSSADYVIFWGPTESTTSALSRTITTPYASLVERFFQDVGGTAYYGILTQYGVSNSSVLAGVYFDSSPYPTIGTLFDSDIRSEVRKVEGLTGWTGGIGHNFFVLTAPGETVCYDSATCSGTDFCGYHDTESDRTGLQTPYVVVPYPENANLASCTTDHMPNGVPGADDAINVISHELFEVVTDPNVGFASYGWYDAAGFEIGDKCPWDFGTVSVTGSNVTLHGNPYVVQEQYSNQIAGCTLS